MKISARIRKLAELAPACESAADIGTDHGYLPIELCRLGKVTHMIASDIHRGPAERAEAHVRDCGLSECIDVRLGNGLSVIRPGEISGAVIAGMGGGLMLSVLEESAAVTDSLEWILLQPMNHVSQVRHWLAVRGWKIGKETFVLEDGQLYQMMLCRKGLMMFQDALWEEIGQIHWQRKERLFDRHLTGLIHRRELLIRGLSGGAPSEKSRRRIKEAQKEKDFLEVLLWKYRQAVSSKS